MGSAGDRLGAGRLRGFSLTELLLVLLIVGAVTAIGAPMLGPATRKGQVRAATNIIVDELAAAPRMAADLQRCARVSLGAAEIEVSSSATRAKCSAVTEWTDVRRRGLASFNLSSLRLEVDGRETTQLVFDPLGRLLDAAGERTASGAHLRVYGEGSSRVHRVEVSSRGALVVHEGGEP